MDMFKSINTKLQRTLFALVCSFAPASQAALIHLPGDTVDFYYDDSQAGMSVYGELSVIGNSIFASPTNFFAEALNGNENSISAFGSITVIAKPGHSFQSVQVAQQGDYQLSSANSTVDVVGNLSIEDSNNASVSEALLMSNTSFSTYGALDGWSSSGSFDLSGSQWLNTQSVNLSLESILNASTSLNGDSAFIQNKFVGGGLVTVETTVVPVPAAAWLFASGLISMIGISRRRRIR